MPVSIRSIWMIGCGQMGQALYRGWCQSGLDIGPITLIDPHLQVDHMTLRSGDHVCTSQADIVSSTPPDILVLAIKPQLVADVLPLYRDLIAPHTLILSIAAGISTARIAQELAAPQQPVIRTMPNTPAMIGQGITAVYPNAHVSDTQRAQSNDLLQATGDVVWLADENLMHAVTAVSGSGPAYVFALIETMANAGAKAGLPPELATQLARQTVIGAAALADHQATTSAAQLRHNVTSLNGTTAAGLTELLTPTGGLQDIVDKTIEAAAKRSRELAG